MASSLPAHDPDREQRRIETLEAYDVLESPPSEAFDRIIQLARDLFDVPIAFVNFLDESEQWCVASDGLSLGRSSREVSFCAHTIESDGLMVVEDATEDPRFADNPFVTSAPRLRFYAGAPLTAPNGHRIGTLCIADREARTLPEGERGMLASLAGVVMDELNLRRYASNLDASRQAHRESRERTSRILESITDAFFALDHDWNFTYVNAQAETLLDRSRDDLVERNIWDVFEEAVDSTFHHKYKKAVAEDDTVEFVEYYPPLESWFEVKAFPYRDGLSVYFDDVTERIEAREDLRRERNLVEAIVKTSVAAIVSINREGEITFANDRAGDILGVDTDRLVGTEYTEAVTALKHLDGSPVSEDEWPFREICATGESLFDRRYTIEGRDDAERILSVNGAPLLDPEGSVEQVVFSMDDITEEVRHRRQLKAAKEEAERASRLKSSFLANMSHDVRTPLSTIMSLTELLSLEAPEDCQERIDLIERSSKRLLATIDSVLDLSRLESGGVSTNPSDIDLIDEVFGTAEIFQPQAKEQGVVLETDIADDEVPARLDTSMLHRIMDNLVSNAIKFTEEGDTVTLRARADDDTVTLEVEDEGVGIDEDFLPDLFEAFARGPGQTKDGSGLGLAITHRLTDVMGGTIDVDSEEGVGTRFTVRLPRYDEE
jgi:PAS domain S-box-containing protein